MDITDIMSVGVVSVDPYDQLAAVKAIFDKTRFHHLLVVEEGVLVGVISDRDLLKSISPRIGTLAETSRDAATLKQRVHQVMSRKAVVLPQTASLSDAVHRFNTYGVSCLPVVNDDAHPVGIVTWRDVLKAIAPILHQHAADAP